MAVTTVEKPVETRAARNLARLRTVASTRPRRIRLLTLATLVVVAALFVAGTLAVGHARNGLRVMGHGAGPQVVATANLYYALSDMDAQVANILLIGKEHDLGIGRKEALQRYELRRAEANSAVLLATNLSGDNPSARKTISTLLDGLGRYERLASQAMLLDEQANHKAGPPPAKVIALYRQATDLMKLELLPKAYNLTLDSGTVVRKTYQDSMSGMASGRVWVGVLGGAAILLLLWLQVFLGVRFRRTLNPALVAATVLTLVLSLGSVILLGLQSDHLRTAKSDGFDAVLAMSRARAISNSLEADESRYLLDPGRADTYEQVYLEKSQTVLYFDSGNLKKYDAGLGDTIDKREFLGFFGDEMERGGLTGDLRTTLTRYEEFQHADSEVRAAVAAGNRHEAIEIRMGKSTESFAAYDKSLVTLIGSQEKVFDDAIKAGDDGLTGWNILLPAGAVAIVLLVLIGIRPRLAEYR